MTRLGGDPADVLGPLVRPERSGQKATGQMLPSRKRSPRRQQRILKAIDELKMVV